MKCLNCLSFVTAHVILNWLISLHSFSQLHHSGVLQRSYWISASSFCFIFLLASNTVIWASLVGACRSKLEVEDFLFHVVVFSRKTFQTLACNFLLCVPQKVFGVYIFPNFVLHVIARSYRSKKLNIPIKTFQSKEKNTN